MTTATIETSDYTVSSILSAAVGFVLEALMKEDVTQACNLLSQMVTDYASHYCYYGYRALILKKHYDICVSTHSPEN